MDNFFPAFFCVLCLVLLIVVCLGTGLGLIHPFLGLSAIGAAVFAMYSVSAYINE